MREALAFARHVLLPRFQDAATERAFITERFSATYGATMTYFLILAFLSCLALPFAEGFLGRCRLGMLMIGYVFVLVARYQHRDTALSPELFKPRNGGSSIGELQAAELPRSTCSDEELPLGVEANCLRHRAGGAGTGTGTGQGSSHANSVEASISESFGGGSHDTAKIGGAMPEGDVPNTTSNTSHHRNHLTALWGKIRARRRSFRWM
jgi:hypothetical protein